MTDAVTSAREHIAYCKGRGMSPADVCESVDAYLERPTWEAAEAIIRKRHAQIEQGRATAIMTDRRVG